MRQYGCIEITADDALLLREAVRPLSKVDPYEPAALIRFCEKLYEAILKLRAEELDAVNIPVDEAEAMIINHFVGNEDWQGALALLEQSWLALYERHHERVYPRKSEALAALLDRLAPGERATAG